MYAVKQHPWYWETTLLTNRKQQKLGELNVRQLTEVLEAASMAVLTRRGWSEQEVYALCAAARKDAKDRKIHAKLDL